MQFNYTFKDKGNIALGLFIAPSTGHLKELELVTFINKTTDTFHDHSKTFSG